MYDTNPLLGLNLREDSDSLEFSDDSDDSGFVQVSPSISILHQAQMIVSNIDLLKKIKKPTLQQQNGLYDSLLEFSRKFSGGSISRALAPIYPHSINTAVLAPMVTEINNFIAAPRDPRFQLKPEFYLQFANPKLMSFNPAIEEYFLNADTLEDLLASHILNIDQMEPCAPRDWAQENTTFIERISPPESSQSLEFSSYPGLNDCLKAISKTKNNSKLAKATVLLAITRYCARFGLDPNQINFIISHLNQNGTLGLVLSLFGGKVIEKWFETNGFKPDAMPTQSDIVFKIIVKPGLPLRLQATTNFNIRKSDMALDLVSQLCVTVEIGNSWRTVVRDGKHYAIPTFANIKFTYTAPNPQACATYPTINSLLDETWRSSRTQFASIEKIPA